MAQPVRGRREPLQTVSKIILRPLIADGEGVGEVGGVDVADGS